VTSRFAPETQTATAAAQPLASSTRRGRLQLLLFLENDSPVSSTLMDNTIVFVLSSEGWVSHGPRRASERQAQHVAGLLRERLGWVTAVGNRAPAVPEPLPPGLPPMELAGLSPVWRDPELAVRWNAASGRKRRK
jgi:hypothetical protein